MPNASSKPRLAFALLAATLIYLCFFARLDALGLVGPDEPRYASVARAMAESGDWITPRLDGEPWLEKPVLYYWAAAAVFRLAGVSEFTARLPSALAATLVALLLAWMAGRRYGAATAETFLLIFPTCVGVFAFARAATTDMLFAAALAGALAAAAPLVLDERGARAGTQAAFGAAVGLATLAKGPGGVVLAGGSLMLWALGARAWRRLPDVLHARAAAGFAATVLPWYTLCAWRNPDFVETFLIGHNLERFFTPVFRHEQPFWFFGPIVLLGLLPWTALALLAGRDAARAWRAPGGRRSTSFFLACWAVFPILFFSFSQSKLPGYVLPAFPALTLLLSRGVAKAVESQAGARWAVAAVGATQIAMALSAGVWLRRLPSASEYAQAGSVRPWLVLAGVVGAGVAALALARRTPAAVRIAALLVAGLVGGAAFRALPRLDPHLSPRAAAEAAREWERQGERIQVYRLHRAWHYGLNFYLQRRVGVWEPAAGQPATVCTSAAGEAELRRLGRKVIRLREVTPAAILVRVEAAR